MDGPAEDRRHHHDVLDLAEHEQEHDRGDRERRTAGRQRDDPDDGPGDDRPDERDDLEQRRSSRRGPAAFGRWRIGPRTIVTITDTNAIRTSWPRSHCPTTTWIRPATSCIWTRSAGCEEPEQRCSRTARRRAAGRRSRSSRGSTSSAPWRSCSTARIAPSGVWRKVLIAAWAWVASSSTVNVRSPIVMLSAAEQLAQGGLERVRAAPDQEADLAGHRAREGDRRSRRGRARPDPKIRMTISRRDRPVRSWAASMAGVNA